MRIRVRWLLVLSVLAGGLTPVAAMQVEASAATDATALSSQSVSFAESFTGTDGVFVSDSTFYGAADLGLLQNASWMATSGSMQRQAGTGRVTSSNNFFRMWTRRTDLVNTTTELDVRFNGWYGGSEGWHGVNLWLNRSLCVPQPDCSKINDVGGDAGYAVDFNNRDGSFLIMKKVKDPAPDGTYHVLASTKWTPVVGQTYRWGGRVVDNGNGTSTIQILIDGSVRLQATDNGSVGGGRLTGGRVGVRADYADVTLDNLSTRSSAAPTTSTTPSALLDCPVPPPATVVVGLCAKPVSVTR